MFLQNVMVLHQLVLILKKDGNFRPILSHPTIQNPYGLSNIMILFVQLRMKPFQDRLVRHYEPNEDNMSLLLTETEKGFTPLWEDSEGQSFMGNDFHHYPPLSANDSAGFLQAWLGCSHIRHQGSWPLEHLGSKTTYQHSKHEDSQLDSQVLLLLKKRCVVTAVTDSTMAIYCISEQGGIY